MRMMVGMLSIYPPGQYFKIFFFFQQPRKIDRVLIKRQLISFFQWLSTPSAFGCPEVSTVAPKPLFHTIPPVYAQITAPTLYQSGKMKNCIFPDDNRLP